VISQRSSRQFHAAFCILAALGCVSGLSAQCGPASGSPAANAWPRVDLNVFVLDRAGNPASSAGQSAFQLIQDGAAQTIQQASGAGSPISLAMLLDSSGSNHAWRRQAISAAQSLIDSLPAGSELAIVFFSDEAFCDFPLAPVASFKPTVFQHMESRGGTALFDALIAMENYFVANAHNPRRALVLISDGGEDASKSSFNDVVRALETPGAPAFFALGAPSESQPNVSPRQYVRDHDNLRKLARAAGGLDIQARNPDDMLAIATKIAAILGSEDALTWRSADTRDGRFHSIEVRLPTPGFAIYGLPGFYAPGD
jgi:Ca-activated chloride channel homolog